MTPVERLIATAKAEVGYIGHRSAYDLDNPTANTGGKYTKYARDIDTTDIMSGSKQGMDWCATFVCWILWKTFGLELFHKITGIPAHSAAAGVGYFADYFKQQGRFFSTPQPGDFICYRNGIYWTHVGLVEKYESGYLYTIEGNAGSPLGVHGFVNPLSNLNVWGYCRCDWSAVPDEKPAVVQPADTAEEEYAKWVSFMERYAKEQQGKQASSWSADARNWAIQAGLFTGDGTGDFHWGEYMTREQAAVLLYKQATR